MKKLDELREILAEGKWYVLGADLLTYDSISSLSLLLGCKEAIIPHNLTGLTESELQVAHDLIEQNNSVRHKERIARRASLTERFETCYGRKL